MRCVDCGTELQPMEGAVSMADFECPKCRPEWFEDERLESAKTSFAALTDEQRLDIMSGYCKWCGTPTESATPPRICHCMNDE